jgi:hypothetical protein
MTDHAQPGTPPATVAPAVPSLLGDAQALNLLLQLLLAERQDAMLEKQAKLEAFKERERQRRQNAEQTILRKQNAQQYCTHKKGGTGLKGPKIDYALSFHTFVDHSSYIRCLICGAKWKAGDTSEYLIRRGEKVPNHTKIGWERAFQMLGESSNTATSSEVKLIVTPVVPTAIDFQKDPRAVEI